MKNLVSLVVKNQVDSIVLALSEFGNISAFVKNFVNSVVKKPDGFDYFGVI